METGPASGLRSTGDWGEGGSAKPGGWREGWVAGSIGIGIVKQ